MTWARLLHKAGLIGWKQSQASQHENGCLISKLWPQKGSTKEHSLLENEWSRNSSQKGWEKRYSGKAGAVAGEAPGKKHRLRHKTLRRAKAKPRKAKQDSIGHTERRKSPNAGRRSRSQTALALSTWHAKLLGDICTNFW